MEYFFMVKFVNKGWKLDICPDEAMVRVLEQNMGNHRFVWNNILARYNDLYRLFKTNNCPLSPTISNLNAILKMLKQEYGSVISAWEFHILDPSKYASFVPPYSFKFHLSFNTLNSFVFSFFSAIHCMSM